jgi:hypothetical protein
VFLTLLSFVLQVRASLQPAFPVADAAAASGTSSDFPAADTGLLGKLGEALKVCLQSVCAQSRSCMLHSFVSPLLVLCRACVCFPCSFSTFAVR